ncbi:hypothetical protein P7M31_23970, partial [Vibrio parahaemolyticus]|nr:hypothetical protein [Vibrio parahaemolyticus]
MNQAKNSRKNAGVDTSKATPEGNPFSTILETGEAPKLGAKAQGKILYEIAQHNEDKQLYFRIAGQSGGAGLHSKHWVPLNELFQLIESQGDNPWKSQVYKSLYP